MSLLHRIRNLSCFATLSRLKAAFGLLSSDERYQWALTIGTSLRNDSLENTYPWFAFRSIEYIERLIKPEMRVLEYGSGYSTLWWAKRVAQVTSVERSKMWLGEVQAALSKHNLNNVRLIPFSKFPPGTEEEIQSIVGPTLLSPIVQEYVHSTVNLPCCYDVVVIDDVFRNDVAVAAINAVKPGGLLILDDSERERYAPTIGLLDSLLWSFASFYGSPPYHFHEKQTTIWLKPQNSDPGVFIHHPLEY